MNEALAALWERYWNAFTVMPVAGWALAASVAVVLVAGLYPWPARWARARTGLRLVCIALAALGALVWAWELRWISDDAFISFRYARNWVEGHGLVFNPGERVEGYTNFLWTAFLAAGLVIGVAPAPWSVFLSLSSLAAVVVLTAQLAKILGPRRARGVIPISAILVATNYTVVSYGTSGLETMFATALVLLSVERALRNRPFESGTAGILATMAHPDHAIFYFALGVAWMLDKSSRRWPWPYALPFGFLYLPYFIARWVYYGSLFPNTYYAKSGGDWYLSQGTIYFVASVLAAGVLCWIPLFLSGLRTQRTRRFGRFIIIGGPVYALYVMKIGGDFMLGRLLVPLLPLAAVSVELGARRLAATQQFTCATIGIALAACSALPLRLFGPAEKLFHIADERWFYPVEQLHPVRIDSPFTTWSDQLINAFSQGSDGPLTATGCIGIVSYRTRYPMLDVFGLTDPKVARLPLASRSRPGHEKLASPSYLLERGVMLTDQLVFPAEYGALTQVFPGLIPLHLVGYEQGLVDALRASGAPPPNVHEVIDGYRAPDELERFDCDLWFFENYYFAHQPEAFRDTFASRLLVRGDLTPRTASFRALPESASPASWTVVESIRFSPIELEGWMFTGDAFDVFPSEEPASGQNEVGRHHGPFANSFTSERGDAATGIAQSPVFRIAGDVITLWVGGGRDIERIHVALVVDGQRARVASGCGSEILGRRVWDVAELRGRHARIVIVDDQRNPWGHIVVDEVEQWRAAP